MAYTQKATHLVVADGSSVHQSADDYEDALTLADALFGTGNVSKVWIVPVTEIVEVA